MVGANIIVTAKLSNLNFTTMRPSPTADDTASAYNSYSVFLEGERRSQIVKWLNPPDPSSSSHRCLGKAMQQYRRMVRGRRSAGDVDCVLKVTGFILL